jgi:hypothetical protein
MFSVITNIFSKKTKGPTLMDVTWQWWDVLVVPLLPRDLAGLKARIIAAVKNINKPMLTRV